MGVGFLDMPGELRNKIYELLLLDEQPIGPFSFQTPAIGLFCTSKEISRESMPFFYSQNCFDFTIRASEDITSYLDVIGSRNAGMIESLYMDCPDFELLDPNVVVLDDIDQKFLTRVQSYCPRLKKITLSITSMSFISDRLDNVNSVRKVLELFDNHLRAFTSLQDINIEVYEDGLNDCVKAEMICRGWNISIKQKTEEYEFREYSSDYGGSIGWDRSDYDHSKDADEYDIDNDSDFWRRAND